VSGEATRELAGSGRHGGVDQVLADLIARLRAADGSRRPTVLDCGGGTGAFAVPLAGAGAAVTVVDTSVDALATLARRATEAGVDPAIDARQGDVETLGDVIGTDTFDLVMAHGVLEAVDDPGMAFTAIARAVGPGGVLSLLVGNPVSAVLARAVAGEVHAALDELRRLDGPDARLSPAGIRLLCEQSGFIVEQFRGIGVFADWVPGTAFEAAGASADLARLEAETATRPPFSDIAARVHLLARRPAG
jgi:S-adenosylmethionine-dependent methyltransferase